MARSQGVRSTFAGVAALAFVGIVGVVGCGAKVDDPRVELTDIGFTLHLPPPMQQALDSIAPGFRAVRATSFRSDVSQAAASTGAAGMPAAFAAIGDYDRDGTVDAVVEGTAPGDSALRVIAIRNGAHPTAIEVTRFPIYDADAVGVYLTNPPKDTPGAFEVVDYPDSTLVFAFKDGAFTGRNIGS
jgi:hypothetical protein